MVQPETDRHQVEQRLEEARHKEYPSAPYATTFCARPAGVPGRGPRGVGGMTATAAGSPGAGPAVLTSAAHCTSLRDRCPPPRGSPAEKHHQEVAAVPGRPNRRDGRARDRRAETHRRDTTACSGRRPAAIRAAARSGRTSRRQEERDDAEAVEHDEGLVGLRVALKASPERRRPRRQDCGRERRHRHSEAPCGTPSSRRGRRPRPGRHESRSHSRVAIRGRRSLRRLASIAK